MSDKCGKCNLVFANVKDCISCVECKLFFHPLCTRISSLENFRKLGAKKQYWKCDECKTDTSSVASRSEHGGDNSVVLDAIQTMREELTGKFDENFKHLRKLQEDMGTVKTDVTILKSDLASLKDENAKLRSDFEEVKAENVSLRSEVRKLTMTVQGLEQYSRVNNLIITGIPTTKGENLYNIMANIAGVLGLEFHDSDISVTHRLPSRDDNRPSPIVAQFVHRSVKHNWLAARRSKKTLKTTELQGRLGEHDVYINEHLSPHTRDVFNRARGMMKSGLIKQVWTSDCKVFIRKELNGRAIKVCSLTELD